MISELCVCLEEIFGDGECCFCLLGTAVWGSGEHSRYCGAEWCLCCAQLNLFYDKGIPAFLFCYCLIDLCCVQISRRTYDSDDLIECFQDWGTEGDCETAGLLEGHVRSSDCSQGQVGIVG